MNAARSISIRASTVTTFSIEKICRRAQKGFYPSQCTSSGSFVLRRMPVCLIFAEAPDCVREMSAALSLNGTQIHPSQSGQVNAQASEVNACSTRKPARHLHQFVDGMLAPAGLDRRLYATPRMVLEQLH